MKHLKGDENELITFLSNKFCEPQTKNQNYFKKSFEHLFDDDKYYQPYTMCML